MSRRTGAAGRVAAAFVHSRLTPLFIIASLLLGVYAVIALPREEEPQIVVPMIDVFAGMPGASPAEVEQRVTRPLEKLLWEVPGVEYLYSTSSAGRAMVVVRFLVGQDEERALVRLNQKLSSNLDRLPHGVTPPLVKPRSIDDVPIMAIALWGAPYDDLRLRQMAAQLQETLKEVPDISEVTILGGRPRQVTVDLDPAALSARGLDPIRVQQAVAAANARADADAIVVGNRATRVESGAWPESAEALKHLVVGQSSGAPVRLADIASVADAAGEPTDYVAYHPRRGQSFPAVTLSIAKRKGVNAIALTHTIEEKLDTIRGYLLPRDVQLTITRNYGETAAQKSNELLWHMLLAVISVSILIWLALGRRESAVVLTAIPVTLALTLFVFYLYGYTLNRITLFALIFSIGILVDDAIVVVENIVRHARMAGADERIEDVAIRAVDEVGNPTILATLTVVAAILPMAFVGGLMGPYMRPIPIGATAAMLFSLVVAFLVTPWAAVRVLKREGGHHDEREDRWTALYRRTMGPLIARPFTRYAFLGAVAALLVAAAVLVPAGVVTVKMLPFDNKSELQVVVRMPEDTPLETTAHVAAALADQALADPAVLGVQSYAGTPAPYTFNGLVRHYFLRSGPNLADLQVMLTGKEERSEQSHAIAKRIRTALVPVAARLGARIQVVEAPPGPPVLQTLVAEVYGPDASRRLELARHVRDTFERTPGVVDVDWYVESERPKWRLDVDTEKAAAAGLAASDVSAVVRMAGSGAMAGLLHDPQAREDVPVVLRLPRERRGTLDAIRSIRLGTEHPVAVGELTRTVQAAEEQSVYHKNLLPVTYVTGDVAGEIESPVYAILHMNRALESVRLPEGYGLEIYNTRAPFDSSKYAMKWDGEWHITYEVFRDLGIAFAAVLVLIYILVVGWFQSFVTPLTIMLAIPFSLVGILPAHAALGAFFTATSMIGFIAGAGIVVRNSIILVDFIELRVRDGMPLEEAVVDAGAVRFRPMALTAAAVIAGSAVILFDPIFQGLAISLMAGEVASLLLSRMTVPITYYMTHRRLRTDELLVVSR
ncbi:MAG: multidrug transporter AcrB [Acidobacteria bacterium RIFCSPLOWO2_02_FULL_65_29]|nr:MAG: multidrug transporter AcrB [Acidobacteria bacterium RIFCSPLOWO2_02_FULL_65_29]